MEKTNSSSDSIAIWCITPNGLSFGRKLQQTFPSTVLFVSDKVGDQSIKNDDICFFKKLSSELSQRFNEHKNHICIFSTGIAVRIIGPLLNSKLTDPAVVVMDDNGQFAISLVSGHIGGANALAQSIGKKLNAIPVITTATDVNKLPAIDMIAQKAGLYIENPENIKLINMAFLKGTPVSTYDPLNILKENLPEEFRAKNCCEKGKNTTSTKSVDVFCSWEDITVSRETLILRPKVLSVGIGCNRNTSAEVIGSFLRFVLKENHLSAHSICSLATTDVKKDEKGLLELSEQMNLTLNFYNKEQLNSVTTIKTPSKMAQKHLGVQSVCEAAAILSADNGKLIVEKHKNKDVTIAVAIKE